MATANAVNRKTVRDAVTALLSAALTGTGKPVQTVVGYPLEYDIGKDTPYVCVTSGGSSRKTSGIGNAKYINLFQLDIMTFVRAPNNAAGWTESLAEDQLDLVEKSIADVIADNRSNSNWSFISFASDNIGMGNMTQIVTDPVRGCIVEINKIFVSVTEA